MASGVITKSSFRPAMFAANRHIQTLLPTFLRGNISVHYEHQEITLPDGDFLDLAWNRIPAKSENDPIVVIFHGLEGSIDSPYVKGLMRQVTKCGWHVVLMHFRNCSGRMNRAARTYHSGETSDARFLIQWLKDNFPYAPLLAVGYSLGGNMLLKLLGEMQSEAPLHAAVAISVPLLLNVCADQMRSGFSQIYQYQLLRKMKQKVLAKYRQYDYQKLIGLNRSKIRDIKDFWDFDAAFTAPINGFKNAQDYYARSSARQYLARIQKPTLIIQSMDDPFMSPTVIPQEDELSSSVCLELSDKGGHVGFVSGYLWKPEFWLEKRVVEYFASHFKHVKL
jgi:predicted alpha/beta-fold hydrolase